MVKINCCPECGCGLSSNTKYCPCGWRAEIQVVTVRDYRCEFVYEKRRCPAKGTICTSIRQNVMWICSAHWKAANDPQKAIAALEAAEKS